jgi:CubicO group peptidase (beta-lactamase class C family)
MGITKLQENKIQELISKQVDNKNCFGTVLSIHKNNETKTFSAGNIKKDTQFFIASTTKLFTSALIFQLFDENKLDFDDYIHKYLDSQIINNLHTYKNKDYSREIKIKHLLSQSSGLSDYFEDKNTDTKTDSLLEDLTKGIDNIWTFEDAIILAKKMSHKFPPSDNKAFYSDTNYQLLGKIIENILENSIENILYNKIIEKLNLQNTYLYVNEDDDRPIDIYFKKKKLHIPKAMSSFKADGGIVSTADEMIIFLRAFFENILFEFDIKNYAHKWNRVMYPLEYGLGIMRFKLPWILSPKFKSMEFVGHSGLSGAYAFYNPDKNVYLTGTVNQINNPGQSFKLMLKILNVL